MIEIMRESRLSWITRRTAGVLGGIAALLALVWLVRGFFGLQPYSTVLLLACFGSFLVGRVFRTETSQGIGHALASFLGNLTIVFFGFILTIWLFSWISTIQNSTFPVVLSSNVPNFAIGLITTGLSAYTISKFTPVHKRGTPTKPAFLVAGGKGPETDGTRLNVKHDAVGLPIKSEGRTVGCVVMGNVLATFDTPMGPITASLAGPVTTVGIPFQGDKLSKDRVLQMTARTPRQLISESSSQAEDMEIERLKKARGCRGLQMKVGPLVFDWDEEHPHSDRWLAKGPGESYASIDGRRVSAKWNGSSLSLDSGTMKLIVGSDSFSYSPTEIKTASPLHSLQITQDKITLDTRKFTLRVSGDNVILRTEEKTSATESQRLANDLRKLLTETAKKHVSDVMEGTPIDLGEMFTSTQEALAIYE